MPRDQKIGPFHIKSLLGSGGMADVYLAERPGPQGIGKRVALKVIRPGLSDDDKFRAMFLHEARIAQRLGHGNVVQVYELGEVDQRYYLAMEYVDGCSLNALLQKGTKLPVHITLYIVGSIARALAYAHALVDEMGRPLELIHRHVSPHNVLISRSGQVKLADFGIAKVQNQQRFTDTGFVKGKIGYYAPEQLLGKPYDQRVDLFALGIVLYQMLVGEHPFFAENSATSMYLTLEKQLEPPSTLNPEVDAELDAIVAHATVKDPMQRYSSAEEMLDALERYRRSRGVQTDERSLSGLMKTLGIVDKEPSGRLLDQGVMALLGGGESPALTGDSVHHEVGGTVDPSTTDLTARTPSLEVDAPSLPDMAKTPSQAGLKPRKTLPLISWGPPSAMQLQPKAAKPRNGFVTQGAVLSQPSQPPAVAAPLAVPAPAAPAASVIPATGPRSAPSPRLGSPQSGPSARLASELSAVGAGRGDTLVAPTPAASSARAAISTDSSAANQEISGPRRQMMLVVVAIVLLGGAGGLLFAFWGPEKHEHPVAVTKSSDDAQVHDAHVADAQVSPRRDSGADQARPRDSQVVDHKVVATKTRRRPRPKKHTRPKSKRHRPKGSAEFGWLSINLMPWAHVYIDGKFIKTTPVFKLKLKAGKHRLSLENPQTKLRRERTIIIAPDSTIKITSW
jgi:serine/threonine protein kinase